jgi:hypothetical protein
MHKAYTPSAKKRTDDPLLIGFGLSHHEDRTSRTRRRQSVLPQHLLAAPQPSGTRRRQSRVLCAFRTFSPRIERRARGRYRSRSRARHSESSAVSGLCDG